jgi:hypothetical protein
MQLTAKNTAVSLHILFNKDIVFQKKLRLKS